MSKPELPSVYWSHGDNEGDNQLGCVLDSSIDSSQCLLDTGRSSAPAAGLRHKSKKRRMNEQYLQSSFPLFTLITKSYKEEMQPEDNFEIFYDKEVIIFITSMFNLYAWQEKSDVSFCTSPAEISAGLEITLYSFLYTNFSASEYRTTL